MEAFASSQQGCLVRGLLSKFFSAIWMQWWPRSCSCIQQHTSYKIAHLTRTCSGLIIYLLIKVPCQGLVEVLKSYRAGYCT